MDVHLASRVAVLEAVTEAQQRILRAGTVREVTDAIVSVVERLGGSVVPADAASNEAIALDVTFGTASARVVEVPEDARYEDALRRIVPTLVEDARQRVADLLRSDMRGNGGSPEPPFVIVSELGIAPQGGDNLREAFEDRLGEVDGFAGFLRLEVWRDRRDPARFVMVSWWRTRDEYVAYMRSPAHRRSHDRIPTEPSAPYPVGVGQFDLVAD